MSQSNFLNGTYLHQYNNGTTTGECHFYKNDKGYLYRNDGSLCLRIKCLGLLVATPIVTTARVINSLFQAVATCFLSKKSPELNGKAKSLVVKEHFKNAWNAIKYGVCMQGSALAGMVLPKFGREKYGQFEAKLNGRDLTHSVMKGLGDSQKEKFYMATCFQPITHADAKDRDARLDSYYEFEKGLKGRVKKGSGELGLVLGTVFAVLGCLACWSYLATGDGRSLREADCLCNAASVCCLFEALSRPHR